MNQANRNQNCSRLGIDIGSVQVKVVLVDGHGPVSFRACKPSQGRPVDVVLACVRSLVELRGIDLSVAVGVTGSGRDLLVGDFATNVNEVIAAATTVRASSPEAATVVDVGGQLSKWIRLGTRGDGSMVVDFATNGACAAGSGAFVEQQARRLGLEAAELGMLAAGAPRAATVAGRCSVFAKSDMIHLQQKGTPTEEIALGLCHAMARTFLGTVVAGAELHPPVVMVGGAANSPGLVRAFREVAKLEPSDVWAIDQPTYACAHGAALHAEPSRPVSLGDLLEVLVARVEDVHRKRQTTARFEPLPALRASVSAEEAPPVPDGELDAYIGIDVGSVSTNIVAVSPSFELLHGEYLATRGRPSDVLLEGMQALQDRLGDRLRVLAMGTTGSGRHLAAAMLGADVVHNEITAQMVSAVQFVPEADTIFEIGGQDSKFISIRNGHLADFEMNKICSAGTGSFLEEQANRLGVAIIGEFAERALRATAPCDLGTQCTVFMDTELVRVQQAGASVDDLCAGLALSVARNYLDRVVARRAIGRNVVFQGGTASNRAVVAAFERLLKREIHVHPYNRLSGAMGAAVLAARRRSAAQRSSRFVGFEALSRPGIRTFECMACENRCQVSRVKVGASTVHFGDACEKYAERDRAKDESSRPFPELFSARAESLHRHVAPWCVDKNGARRIGLVQGSVNLEMLPFWTSFLAELGRQPVPSPRADTRLLARFPGGVPADVCLPIKAAAAQARALLADEDVERVFVPDVLEFPDPGKESPSVTCLYSHQLGDMLRASLGPLVVSAKVRLTDDMFGLLDEGLTLAEALDAPVEAVVRALRTARIVHKSFDDERIALGRQALDADFDRAVVVLGKPYNTHEPMLNLSLARHLERLGLPAIPWDLMPIADVELPSKWDRLRWRFNRDQLRVLALVRRDPRLFPVWVSSFGCGPDGFAVKHLEDLLTGRPRLFLEFDEHRGEAGLVTRLEAFLDEIEAFQRSRTKPSTNKAKRSRATSGRARYLIPLFSEHARVYEAALRSGGLDAHCLPPTDEVSLRYGEEHASGRECHPYTILLGDAVRHARSSEARGGDVFFFPNSENPCLINQYGEGIRKALEQDGNRMVDVWDPVTDKLLPLLGRPGLFRLYEGMFSVDVLLSLRCRLRAYEQRGGEIDEVFERGIAALCGAIQHEGSVASAFESAARDLCEVPRDGNPWDRPVVGVTGDMFTRTNTVENADLWRRLERMGCEVWPSTYVAQLSDLGSVRLGRRALRRGELRGVAERGFAWMLTSGARLRLMQQLPGEVRSWVEEPAAEKLFDMAAPYVDPWSSPFVIDGVAKTVDFLERGVSGVVSAVGLNCMAGVSMSAVAPRIRDAYGQAPILTLSCGGTEGPAQRIRLETFVEQVKERARKTGRRVGKRSA
jgi:predicted CoA-substrate-specific enzyme activase